VTPIGDFNPLLSVVSACPAGFQDCEAGSDKPAGEPETVEHVMSKGEKVWVIVDGSEAGEKGSFTLSVEELSCEAQCAGKTCGDDKCGDVCGTCDESAMCAQNFLCVEKAPNDTCATALAIPALTADAPFQHSGSTLGANPDYVLPDGVCEDGPAAITGGAGNDVVYVYTAPENQTVLFSFLDFATDFNSNLYVVANCSDYGLFCKAAVDSPVNGKESVVVDLAKNQTVFIIVDGQFKVSNGPYTFTAALKP